MSIEKITVVGVGYVGLSMAVLLSQKNKVYAVDISEEKINNLKQKKSPLKDEYIEKYLGEKELDLHPTTDLEIAVKDSNIVVIATPTNYDSEKNYFDTTSVEETIKKVIAINSKALIVIKSTIPVGFTEKIKSSLNFDNIVFSPEFLRESKALYDNLYPSRIIVGVDLENEEVLAAAKEFMNLLKDAALNEVETFIMGSTEAEAVKLFSNTYLALRVSYFNELDTYAEVRGLDTESIIKGVSKDPRIGDYYNNPSFGYGGYCLPKDSKQLLANYDDIPQNMITAIVDSNETRKEYIANSIIEKINSNEEKERTKIGVYRLAMKTGSDNFRESSIFGVIEKLAQKGYEIIIFEPEWHGESKYEIVADLEEFKEKSSIIITNRYDKKLEDVKEKVYTRDLFKRD